MMSEPQFLPGAKVSIPKIGKIKTVVESRPYAGGPDREYVLVDEDGVEDEGWLEHELRRVR